MMMIGGLSFVATLAFEIPFAKLEMMLIGGKLCYLVDLKSPYKIFLLENFNLISLMIFIICKYSNNGQAIQKDQNTSS